MQNPFYNHNGLLDKSEAAKFLHISKRTLDGYMRQRRIPFYKLGRGQMPSWDSNRRTLRRFLPPIESMPCHAEKFHARPIEISHAKPIVSVASCSPLPTPFTTGRCSIGTNFHEGSVKQALLADLKARNRQSILLD